LRRQAGIKAGDRPVKAPTYKPTKSELTAIQKGEAQIARGDYVSLTDFLHDVDRHRRKGGAKVARKISG
jgi:hypothetical protein